MSIFDKPLDVMRMGTGRILLLIAALFSLGQAVAQREENTTHVLLAAEHPVRIFFPGKVSKIIGGHPSVGVRSLEQGTVQLSVLTPEFEDTQLTVILTDGRQFAFDITFSSDIREVAGAYSSAKSNPRIKAAPTRSRAGRATHKGATPDRID